MRSPIFLILICFTLIPTLGIAKVNQADRNQRVSIEHGKVIDIERVEMKSNAAKGATYGGLIGVASQHGRHGKDIVAGAAVGAIIGALIGKATSGHKYAHAIYIQTLNGDELKVVSEQDNLRVGDCVTVESGKYTNVRIESQVVCNPAAGEYRETADMQKHNDHEASSCTQAKERLLNADDSQDLKGLAYKVEVLCEN